MKPNVKKYIKDDTSCPFCESIKIVPEDAISTDLKGASQHIACHNCGAEWYDQYTLTGISVCVEPSA